MKKFGSIVFPSFEPGFNFMREVALQKIAPASVRLMDNVQFQFGQSMKSESVSWVSFKTKSYLTASLMTLLNISRSSSLLKSKDLILCKCVLLSLYLKDPKPKLNFKKKESIGNKLSLEHISDKLAWRPSMADFLLEKKVAREDISLPLSSLI